MRCHTATRRARGVAEELMPSSDHAAQDEGHDGGLQLRPAASPMLAMFPQKSTVRVSQVSISPPKLSIAPP